ALEADRDYGTGFMAHKRARKALKVREPLARYVLRDAVPVASTSVAVSGAGTQRAARGPASGAGTQRAARGPSEWRDDWTAGERDRRQAAEGVGTGGRGPWCQRPGLKTHCLECIASSALPRVHRLECIASSASPRAHRLECIASTALTITASRKRDV
ncbi:MAG TPA: hypothetical protein VI197_03820, partial [Polyangiaceae bacterium]